VWVSLCLLVLTVILTKGPTTSTQNSSRAMFEDLRPYFVQFVFCVPLLCSSHCHYSGAYCTSIGLSWPMSSTADESPLIPFLQVAFLCPSVLWRLEAKCVCPGCHGMPYMIDVCPGCHDMPSTIDVERIWAHMIMHIWILWAVPIRRTQAAKLCSFRVMWMCHSSPMKSKNWNYFSYMLN
jgi:hypothetical protein